MTVLSNEKPTIPLMGRADVLFRFLQKIEKTHPKDLEPYLDGLNVQEGEGSIVEQVVDRIIAGNKDLYTKYIEARIEAAFQNPHTSPGGEDNKDAFLRKWIALEEMMKALPKQPSKTIISNSGKKFRLEKLLGEIRFSQIPTHLCDSFDRLNVVRHAILHKGEMDEQRLASAIQEIDALTEQVKDYLKQLTTASNQEIPITREIS